MADFDFSGFADGTDLASVPGWSRVDGASGAVTIQSEAALFGGNTTETAYTVDAGSASHSFEVDLAEPSSIFGSDYRSFYCCRLTDANNFIGFRLYTNEWQIFERSDGAFTEVASGGSDSDLGGRYRLEVDDEIRLYRDDVLLNTPVAPSAAFDGVTTVGVVNRGGGGTEASFDNVLVDAPVGTTNATATPSGVSATGTVGTVSVALSPTVSPTGVSGTGQVGTVTVSTGANDNATPAGVSGTGSVGTVTVKLDSTATVEGVSGTGQVGTVTVDASGNATAVVEGVSGTGQVGSPAVTLSPTVTLTGVSGTGQIGTAAVSTSATVTPSGLKATGQVGAVTASSSLTVAPEGVSASGRIGTVTVAGVAVTVSAGGVSATGQVGAVRITGIQSDFTQTSQLIGLHETNSNLAAIWSLDSALEGLWKTDTRLMGRVA